MKAADHKTATIRPWLKANLGKGCLAGLTGSDARLLDVVVCIVEALTVADHLQQPHLLTAFHETVESMQRSQQHLAYHAIAHAMDWTDRDRIWAAAGLPFLMEPGTCLYEPATR